MAEARLAETFTRLVDLVSRLRAPGGCPWDREQTPRSLRPYLLEEAHEVLEAIDRDEPIAIRDELGDLLLQVVLQSELAAEAGRFTIADVASAITDKLVRRHPHVFGTVEVRDAADVVRNWSRIKAEERRAAGDDGDVFAGIPASLPALAHAQRLGDRARQVSLDWPDTSSVLEKVREEQSELEAAIAAGDGRAVEHELGDLLLTLTSLARHLGVSAEVALRAASSRFVARVRRLEATARACGGGIAELGPADRDRLWEAAKAASSPRPRV
jgi:MazG family protein